MQNFTYHAHTNGQGIFDGRNTASEMICRAEELGFEELGISNHLIFHPNLKTVDKMFFNDFDVVSSVMQKNAEEIRRAADRAKIKVLVGFEVDFFPSSAWRLAFEKLQKTLRADYYIGSCHFLRNKEETKLVNMYLYREGNTDFLPSELGTGLEIYWQNVALAAESGYFDFLAHLDVYKIFPYLQNLPEPESQSLAIDTVCRLKHPYELVGANAANSTLPFPFCKNLRLPACRLSSVTTRIVRSIWQPDLKKRKICWRQSITTSAGDL